MWNPFKKKEPLRLPEDADKARKRLIGRLNSTPIYVSGEYVNTTVILPKLTKTELVALESCINFATKGAKTVGIEHNLRKAVHMKALTDKGYLVRVKKGHYQLSFYGTKRT